MDTMLPVRYMIKNYDGAVDDVDYCIEQAEEWEAEDENNAVFVEEL